MLGFAASLVAVWLGICAVAFLFQRRLIYFPGPPPSSDPATYGLAFEQLDLETADGESLDAWLLTPEREPRGAILYSHGNAGTIEGRIHPARSFLGAGWAVLLYDYRGFGRSTGTPGEEGTYLDAEAAYDALVARGHERIVAYGESLGGAVSIELARRRELAGLIVESTFTSLGDVAAGAYPFLPVRTLLRHDYASVEKIGALGIPVCVVHSPADEIVPYRLGEELFEAAAEPKLLVRTEAGHNDGGALVRPHLFTQVQAFLEQLAR